MSQLASGKTLDGPLDVQKMEEVTTSRLRIQTGEFKVFTILDDQAMIHRLLCLKSEARFLKDLRQQLAPD